MSVVASTSHERVDASRVARYAAYAFLVSMPWAAVFAGSVNPHDAARIFQSLTMCLAAWAFASQGGAWLPGGHLARVALCVVIPFGGLSVLLAEHWTYAALEASAMVLVVVVAIVLARAGAATLARELPAVVALAALMAVAMELPRWYFFLADGRIPQAADFGFMYMSHRFFNHAQTLVLALAFLPLLMPVPRWARVAAWVGVVGGLALLWRTGGRGTLLAFGVFACLLPWLLRHQVRRVVRVLAIAVLAAALAYVVCFVLPAMWLGLPQDHRGNATMRLAVGDDSGRFYLWQLALEDAMRHPFVGVGPMHYAHLPNLLAAHPHNSVAQWAAEWGVPVTVVAIVALGVLFARALKRIGDPRTAADTRTLVAIGGLATLIGCVDSLFSGTLVMPVSQVWWTVALACLLAGTIDFRHECAIGHGASLRRLALIGLVALHLAASAVTYHRSTQPPVSVSGVLERNNVPRYWINGRF